jgi:tetratricopeptide (TPR) repeat protein
MHISPKIVIYRMRRSHYLALIVVPATIAMVGLSGCAAWDTIKQATARNKTPDVGPPREDRKAVVAKDFDEKRSDAQYEAALSCWQRGDVSTCNQFLSSLLDRSPNDRRARLLLADVYMFNGQLEESAEEYNKAVVADPKDAAAQHQLAEVLDALGRRSEALSHYEEATHLEPNNELYTLSYKQATGLVSLSDRSAAETAKVEHGQATAAAPVHPLNDSNVKQASAVVADNFASGAQPAQPAQSAQLATANLVASADATPLERAVVALAADDTAGAIELASRGLAATPERAVALYRVLGTAHYRRGEYQAAQGALAQALSLDKSDALTYFLMGSVLDKLNDHDGAGRCYAEAARLDGRFAN